MSNHGGRQLDSVPSTARALPEIVDAVGDQVEVLVGRRRAHGLDVVKMLALGARAVPARPRPGHGPSRRGARRASRHVLDVLRADIDVALGLTGVTAVADLDRSALLAD